MALLLFVNKEGPDQPVYSRSWIMAFVGRLKKRWVFVVYR